MNLPIEERLYFHSLLSFVKIKGEKCPKKKDQQQKNSPLLLLKIISNDRAKIDGDVATVGITDHAQAELGDIVYVELPEVGSEMEATKSFGVVESVKAASDLFTPVSGKIVKVNEALDAEPGLANSDPTGNGWFFKIKLSDANELNSLMDEASYNELIAD